MEAMDTVMEVTVTAMVDMGTAIVKKGTIILIAMAMARVGKPKAATPCCQMVKSVLVMTDYARDCMMNYLPQTKKKMDKLFSQKSSLVHS